MKSIYHQGLKKHHVNVEYYPGGRRISARGKRVSTHILWIRMVILTNANEPKNTEYLTGKEKG